MFIALEDGNLIPASDLVSATMRTDLIPVPVSLELVAQRTAKLEADLAVGKRLMLGTDAIPMVIVKSQVVKTQIIRDADTLGAIAVVAVLAGCEALIKPSPKAIILSGTSLAAACRACGGRSPFGTDIPLPEFVCLKGGMPTAEIARRLQEEGAAIRYRGGKMHGVRLPDLFSGQPVATFDASAVQWEDNDAVVNRQVVSVVSLAVDGVTVYGDPSGVRPVVYRGGLDSRRAKNMERVLVTRGRMLRPSDDRLQAGELVQVGDRRLVILTAAHRIDTGALGGSSAMATKVWLAELLK